LLINRFVNNSIIQPLRTYKKILPARYLYRLPVVGTFNFKNKAGIPYKFATNGYDPTANLLYWSNGQDFEPHIINLLHTICREAEVLFDVGANTGFISIHMALLPLAKEVYAFEPLPRAFRVLKKNLELNALNNYYGHQLALGDSNGKSTLYVPNVEAIPTSSSLDRGFYQDHSEIDIKIVTMDYFVKTNNISRIDVVKIDVEGRELDVLLGMKATIEDMRPFIICEILSRTGDLIKTTDFMKQFEYYIYEILDNQIKPIEKISEYKRNNCIDFLLSPTKQFKLHTG